MYSLVGSYKAHTCFGILLLVLAGTPLEGAAAAASHPLIVAHRGASQDAPENTLAAFRLAWQQGADAVEGDFFLTKDGVVVCCHDPTTKRMADRDLTIADATLAELKELDVGAWKGPQWRGQRIPTVDEVFATIPRGKKIYLEIKCGPEIFPPLKAAWDKSKLRPEQAVVIAFNAKVLAEAKRRLPQLKTFWLTGYKKDKTTGERKPSIEEMLATLKSIRADGVSISYSAGTEIDAGFVEKIRGGGYEFHVGLVEKPSTAERFRLLGADSMTTNQPAWLRRQLKGEKD